MTKKLLAALIGAMFGTQDTRPRKPLGRFRFQDSAQMVFTGRMPAGMNGDISRHHPVSVEPGLINSDFPPLFYGIPVLVSAAGDPNSLRPYAAADASDATDSQPWGFTVRPYPAQQDSGGMTSTFGSETPPSSGVVDTCRAGYMMSFLPAGGAAVKKGDPVYVWCAASAGNEVQSRLTATFSAGNTVKLTTNRYTFNGPADALGNIEVCVNV